MYVRELHRDKTESRCYEERTHLVIICLENFIKKKKYLSIYLIFYSYQIFTGNLSYREIVFH